MQCLHIASDSGWVRARPAPPVGVSPVLITRRRSHQKDDITCLVQSTWIDTRRINRNLVSLLALGGLLGSRDISGSSTCLFWKYVWSLLGSLVVKAASRSTKTSFVRTATNNLKSRNFYVVVCPLTCILFVRRYNNAHFPALLLHCLLPSCRRPNAPS